MMESATKKYGHLTKELMSSELAGFFSGSESFFVVGNEKLPTQSIEGLRRTLRQSSARYVVVKNSLCQRIFKEKSLEQMTEFLQGQTAIVFAKGDPAVIAKAIVQFAKGHETFKVRGAIVSGQLMDLGNINLFASLPSREVLITKVVRGVKAPITGLVFSLSGLLRQLVTVLDGVRQKKS